MCTKMVKKSCFVNCSFWEIRWETMPLQGVEYTADRDDRCLFRASSLQRSKIIILIFKLQPAIFPLSQHVIRFHELPADTTQHF